MNNRTCIFENNDIVIQQDIVETKASAISFTNWNSNRPFFAINPVKHLGDSRKNENVSVMKNFLFESDTMTLDQQKELLKEMVDNISMATYSGNKSIHFIIQIEDAPNTKEEYHYVWNLLKNKYFSYADTQTKDCNRLSRTPNAIRDNNRKQILIWNKLQPIKLNWRPLYERIVEYRQLASNYRKEIPIRRNEELTYEAKCILDGYYPKGERDYIIRSGLPYLYYNGYNLEELLANNMCSRNNPQTIRNFYLKLKSGYIWRVKE
jgi:hypothetical protein